MSDDTTTFTVTKEQLVSQLTLGARPDPSQDHWLWQDKLQKVITEDGPRSAQQVAWYLYEGVWVDKVYVTCGYPQCLTEGHLTATKATADQATAKQDLALIQTTSISLADLYRRGKARGLMAARTTYY